MYYNYDSTSYTNGYHAGRGWYEVPSSHPEKRFTIGVEQNSLSQTISRIFLTVVTLGYWSYRRSGQFEQALLDGDTQRANEIVEAGWVDDVGEKFVAKLMKKNQMGSLHFLIKREFDKSQGYEIATQAIRPLYKCSDLDAFLKGVPDAIRATMANKRYQIYRNHEGNLDSDWNSVLTLLDHGLDRDVASQRFFSCTHPFKDAPTRMRRLIDRGLNPDVKNEQGNSVLFRVVEEEQVFCCEQKFKSMELVALLLQQGVAVDEPGKKHGEIQRVTPLYLAARKGNEIIVQQLLDAGADPNKRIEGGRSPYEAALYGPSWTAHTIQVLRSYGGTTTQAVLDDAFEKTLSFGAAMGSDQLEKLELLRHYGAVATQQVATEALHRAIAAHNLDYVRFLRDSSADLTHIDELYNAAHHDVAV